MTFQISQSKVATTYRWYGANSQASIVKFSQDFIHQKRHLFKHISSWQAEETVNFQLFVQWKQFYSKVQGHKHWQRLHHCTTAVYNGQCQITSPSVTGPSLLLSPFHLLPFTALAEKQLIWNLAKGLQISAASGPKFTILWGHVEEILLLNKFFSDCRYMPYLRR